MTRTKRQENAPEAVMVYNEKLAARVRKALARYQAVAEIEMFGGLCFTLRGNMCCGVLKDNLVVRVGPEQYEKTLAEPYARPMDFTGRPIKGLVFVGPGGYRTEKALATWVKEAVDFALSLPPKEPEHQRKRRSNRGDISRR